MDVPAAVGLLERFPNDPALSHTSQTRWSVIYESLNMAFQSMRDLRYYKLPLISLAYK